MGNLTVLARKPTPPFAWMPLDILEDPELSTTAKALYAYLNSRPVGWEVRRRHIMSTLGVGKDAISNASLQLQDAGLLRIDEQRDERGRFVGVEWVLTAVGKAQRRSNRKPAVPESGDRPRTSKKESDQEERYEEGGGSHRDHPLPSVGLPSPSRDPVHADAHGNGSHEQAPRRSGCGSAERSGHECEEVSG